MTNINADYTAQLRLEYEDLRKKVRSGMLPLVARIPAIEDAVSAYVLAQDAHYEELRRKAAVVGGDAGGSPEAVPIQLRDATALHRMADLVLHEELTWSHPDKMAIVEYPVMSDDQETLRQGKYSPNSDLQYGDRRHQGRRKTHFTDNDGAPQVRNPRIADPSDPEIDRIDVYIDLYDALDNAGLTGRQRQVVDLVYFDDMTQSSAANILGVSQPAIAKFERQALAKLRDYMTKD